MARTKQLNGHFFQVPNGIHRVVGEPSDLSVLIYLIQCSDGNGRCFPSYRTISQGIMSRRQAIISVRRLTSKGIISIEQKSRQSNIFTVNCDHLVKLIHQCNHFTSEMSSPPSEMSSPPSEMSSPPLVKSLHPNNTKLNNNQLTILNNKEGSPSHQLSAETPASKYLFEKTGRKRWGNLVQKEEFEKAEEQFGEERMKNAVGWALASGISNIKSIITAAKKGGKDNGTHRERPRAVRAHDQYTRPEQLRTR